MGADEKAKRIIRFASALWHGDRGRLGHVEAYLAEAKQIADALPGLDVRDVIELSKECGSPATSPQTRSGRP
jgi:type II secretory pathway component PulM